MATENSTEQKHKENVRKPQQPGPCGSQLVTVVTVVKSFGYREQTLVWWNDADPHSFFLVKDYFGALWTLPRKYNNFGVSSFVYLLCFSSNESQERDVYSCFWPLSQGDREEGCKSICVPECVIVAWIIIAFGTFELLLWSNTAAMTQLSYPKLIAQGLTVLQNHSA